MELGIRERCDYCGKCLEFCPYVEYDLRRAQAEMKELVAGGTPPIVGRCVTCASCNLVCPTQANPFDLLNQRQEETGALILLIHHVDARGEIFLDNYGHMRIILPSGG